MFRSHTKCAFCLCLLLVTFVCAVRGQDGKKVPISFLPPPLENATYSLGIYEAKSGKLVRRLREIAPESAFAVGLNGLMTSWDGKDDEGKAVPPGRYAARGYAVGPMKVEGKQILGNDWANDDEGLRPYKIQAIALVPEDGGLAILAVGIDHELIARYGGPKTELSWQKPIQGLDLPPRAGKQFCSLNAQENRLQITAAELKASYQLTDGSEISPAPTPVAASDPATTSGGKDGTVWKIESGLLCQYSPQGELLRSLEPKKGEPVPVAVAAAKNADRLFLLEETANGDWQRVRGLQWKEASHEGGKAVSTWETFFERSIHVLPEHGEGETFAATGIEQTLVENPLSPGKTFRLKLNADYDAKGSYLVTAAGLRLRQISEKHPRAVKLSKAKSPNALAFYQSDGAAWDEFSIEGAKNMMEFDAGEIEMTADGEKTHPAKAAEPPDL